MFKVLKRWLPALLALTLGLAYYGYTDHQQVQQAALATAVRAGQLNADSATIAEAANTTVPPFGLVAGKLGFACLLFFGGLALVWFVLRFVMPVLPQWATGHGTGSDRRAGQAGYKEAFAGLHAYEQARTFTLVWLALLGYYALCVLAACLVN